MHWFTNDREELSRQQPPREIRPKHVGQES